MDLYRPLDKPLSVHEIPFHLNENPIAKRYIKPLLPPFSLDDMFEYSSVGELGLRESLALFHKGNPEDFVFNFGSEAILRQIFQALFISHCPVAIFDPTWSYYAYLVSSLGNQTVPIDCWDLNFSFSREKCLEQGSHLLQKNHVWVVTTPNNPTGSPVSQEDVAWIAETFKPQWLIIDSAYDGFQGFTDYRSLIKRFPFTLVTRTFSKFFGLSGLRLGYAQGNPDVLKRLTPLSPVLGLPQYACQVAQAILSQPEIISSIQQEIQEIKDLFHVFKGSSFHVYPSSTHFLWVQVPETDFKALQTAFIKENYRVKSLIFKGHCFFRITLHEKIYVERLIKTIQTQLG